ncbi:hypothetical protein [Salipiger thiooxidans]|nr:hypothetical protein [Salipiger thiooxidans]
MPASRWWTHVGRKLEGLTRGASTAKCARTRSLRQECRPARTRSRYGSNAPDGTGTTIHCIEQTQTLIIGTYAYDEDLDGDGGAGAFKCSNDAQMWLWNTIASASGGSLTNYAIEANGGTVLKRNHTNAAGTEEVSGAGSIGTF